MSAEQEEEVGGEEQMPPEVAQALAAQLSGHLAPTITGPLRPTPAALETVDAALVQADKKNAFQVRCPMCNCKVLPPGTGLLVERTERIFLHADVQAKRATESGAAREADGTHERWFWLVTDMFHFDNIGFSRDVGGAFKYLTCADCEAPILGIQPSIAKANELLLSVSRPKYDQ